MGTIIKDGDKFLFTGDSITDCARREDQYRPYGTGYVNFFRNMMLVSEPEKNVEIINTGIGGNTVEDLRSRCVDDVLSHKPDLLSVKIGINDCNRYVTDPENNNLQSPDNYRKIYHQILSDTKKELPNVKILLIDPFYASLDNNNIVSESYRGKVSETLSEYIQTVKELSEEFGTLRVKTHEIFHNYFKFFSPKVCFPHEPVHPNEPGHMIIAEHVYRTLET